MSEQMNNDVAAVDALHRQYQLLKKEIGHVIIGQDDVVKTVLIGILSNGHCLLVGVPGLAKTLLVQTLAKALHLSANRVQFTPDLMPGDITGNEILGENKAFQFVKGPVFANLLLADEINRTPPKTQAALLEAMQERAVTVSGKSYALPAPFFVLATQNPIEQEGTYPLPEAQLDRFMFNIWVDYPSLEDEINIVKNTTGNQLPQVKEIITGDEILAYQALIRKVPVTDNVLKYAVTLVNKTRPSKPHATEAVNKYVSWGAGPRASQYLIVGAKCHAVLNGKYTPDIEDVQAVALPILRHRVALNYKAEAEGLTIEKLLKQLY